MDLPLIDGVHLSQIHQFYERLLYDVQSLETMRKLQQVNGNVSLTIDKLSGIRGDLARNDDNWQDNDFFELCEALRSGTRRNPLQPQQQSEKNNRRRIGAYTTRQQHAKARVCVYCNEALHKGIECQRVSSVRERKRILINKKLCFNCTGMKHRASECSSKTTCQICSKRHHTSICDQSQFKGEKMMSACNDDKVVHPIVVVKVGGIECRALIDSGAASSYASAKLLDKLGKQPTDVNYKKVEMLMATTTTRMEVHKATVASKTGDYQLDIDLIKVNKGKLLEIENPRYEILTRIYPYLKGIRMDDNHDKPLLPVHVILGARVYAKIKMDARPRIENQGKPVAEQTKLGWFILSPGEQVDTTKMLLTQTSQIDYEELCLLDVLGLADSPQHDQDQVYSEFREQLSRNKAGWYETGLPWKGNHPPLPTNEQGSLRRLQTFRRKLQRFGIEQEYAEIIEEQKTEGVVETADQEVQGVEFYIPHKLIIKEAAETTKIRTVYDASAKAQADTVSLNDCLYAGPTLQNKLWNVLVRVRAHSVAVIGDLRKAFLQVRVKPVTLANKDEETYAKQQLGKPKGAELSILGLAWNKERDEISVSFPEVRADATKRGVLHKLSSIYDPFGLASPVILQGKLLYRAICHEKTA